MRFVTALAFIASLAAMAPPAFCDSARDNAWRQDLNYLASTLPAVRYHFSLSISPASFASAISELSAAVPGLSDARIAAGMARIVALLNDPHTNLNLPQSSVPMHFIPLRLQWFADGLYVTGAADAFARSVGTRVTRIGAMDVNDAYRAVAPFISHQNDEWLRYKTPGYLNNADLLAAAGVVSDLSVVHVEFVDLTGAPFSFEISSSLSATINLKLPDTSTGYTPLYRTNANQFYWYSWLAGSGTLYFKYNSCANTPGLPFTQFAQELMNVFDGNPVQTFVVDLRGNTGGDSTVIYPLLAGLQQRTARFRNGTALEVLIDEGTISSALLNAETLNGLGFAKLRGAATGGTPNHFGNIQSLTLPNSQLVVNYATTFFASFDQNDSLHPEVSVALTSADYFSRFDPVMASVGLPATGAVNAPVSIAVVNSADFNANRPVAPGSLATAFGNFVNVGDVRLLVNGAPAPLLAVTPSQLNFQVPAATPLGLQNIAVTVDGQSVASDVFSVAMSAPAMFVVSAADIARPGAILNADSTLNTQTNAAARGDLIQIYATGQGTASQLTTRVIFGHEPARVLYSGFAPTLTGVWQINAQVPDAPSVSGQVSVFAVQGNAVSSAVTVWIAK